MTIAPTQSSPDDAPAKSLIDALQPLARGTDHHFRQIIDALPVPIYTTDPHGKLTHFNPACIAFAGRIPQLAEDHYCITSKLFHPDGQPMPHDQCPMAIALRTKQIIQNVEAIAERPDGSRVWFTPFSTPLFDDAGNLTGGVNMLIDITDRKHAEQARRHSEKQLAEELADTHLLSGISAELIHENNVQALYGKLIDAAVTIMRSDFASMQMLYPERGKPGGGGELRLLAQRGFPPEAAKFWEWVRADSGCTCGQVLRTGKRALAPEVQTCDFMANTPDRDAYLSAGLLAAQSTPLISRSGALVGMISTHWKKPHHPSERDLRLLDLLARQAADLVERMRNQEALRASEERFRTLADAVPVLVWVSDLTKSCTWFNKHWRDFSGRPNEQLIGDGWAQDVHPDDLQRCLQIYVTNFDARQPFSMEYRLKRHDGEYRWILDEGIPRFDPDGAFAGYIGACMDFTERIQAEKRAQSANRAKDKFLAVLSHELRTPLSPVLMTASILELRPDLSPELRQDMSMIRRNVELQSRLIDDLLDLSRITSGKLRLTFTTLSINELVSQACEICRSNLQERGIALVENLAPGLLNITGDGGRVQQVVWNLLNNATKFTPERGTVFVSTENIPSPGQPRIRITVRDTGIGIAPDDLARIFDAFEQAAHDNNDDVSIARKFGGMGLGLAICRPLVEQHRGTITVHSDGKDHGSTFIVEFPAVARPTNADHNAQPPASQKIGPLRLLLVEDHADTAQVLARLLKRAGHSVNIAHTGADALTLAAQNPFDFLISDLGLPDMTGHELMHRIRQHHTLPGIALSGFGMEDDINKSRNAGFADHLTKPATVEQLEHSIRRIMLARNPQTAET